MSQRNSNGENWAAGSNLSHQSSGENRQWLFLPGSKKFSGMALFRP